MRKTKVVLPESELPRQWYNVLADFPKPMPPVLHPATKKINSSIPAGISRLDFFMIYSPKFDLCYPAF